MQYLVTFPRPSAKRMANKKTLKIIIDDLCSSEYITQYSDGCNCKLYNVDKETEFKFDLPDNLKWKNSLNISGTEGIFSVYLEYSNSTGTRKEIVELVPKKLD
jgi:hypothetical protein